MSNISRHANIFRPDMLKDKPIHIIGCGATGSNIALNLVKLGVPTLHLYDMDVVEDHNLANQMFLPKHIGCYKSESLAEFLCQFRTNESTEIFPHVEKVSSENAKNLIERGIVFCITDTMSSRKEIFENLIMANPAISQYIETRMALDSMRAYQIRPSNYIHCEKYNETIYDDTDTVESACGTTQTAFPTASCLASIAVWFMLSQLKGNNKYRADTPNEFIQYLPSMEQSYRFFE